MGQKAWGKDLETGFQYENLKRIETEIIEIDCLDIKFRITTEDVKP